MHPFKLSFKQSALWVLGLTALFVEHVDAQSPDRSGRPCRGWRQKCPRGYQCVRVKGRYRSICQKRPGYKPPPSYLSSVTTEPFPEYTTPSDKYSSNLGYDPTTIPNYEPTTTLDYLPTSIPGYDQSSTPDYEPSSTPDDYKPTSTPDDYKPTSTPDDYKPTSTPDDYKPTSTPDDYKPSSTPDDYKPTSTPDDYKPTSTPGYEPSSTPDYEPTPPSGYPPSSYTSRTPTGYSSSSRYYPTGSNTTYGNPGPTGSSFTPVVGVPNKVVERRPIGVLQSQYPDVFNMFVLALESLQKKSEQDDVSYFQLSGIHGWPYIPWQYPGSATRVPDRGYCTHNSALFLTWHRPYLCLIEQLLHAEAVKIAGEFSGSDAEKYKAAADDVRLPYWDWASDDGQTMPAVMTQSSISVTKPSGTTQIENPLFAYRFQNPPDRNVGLAPITERSPRADSNLRDSFQSRQEATLRLFTISGFNEFSSQAEGVHGWVHVDIGDDMGSVPSAAFDPVFWLHHCQVDRIWAMWQATHPGDYMTPAPRDPTFALDGPGPDDLSTPLYPFRHPNGREWTSDEIKDAESIFEYGYSYPEVPAARSGEQLRTFATERVNTLYGPDVQATSFNGTDSGVPEVPNARVEWGANVVVDKEELPGSFRIKVFLAAEGQSQEGSAQSASTGNSSTGNSGNGGDLVGVAPIFSTPQQMPEGNRFLNFTVPLTNALLEKNIALNPQEAVPNLADRLYWVVEKVGDSEESVPATELSTLKVAVTGAVTEYPENAAELPEQKEVQTYFAPTEGKPGGLQEGEPVPVGSAAPSTLDTALTGDGNSGSGGNGTTTVES